MINKNRQNRLNSIREKALNSHVKNNDYFGTLATVISLIKQTINDERHKKNNLEMLNRIEDDLLYMQNNYRIISD